MGVFRKNNRQQNWIEVLVYPTKLCTYSPLSQRFVTKCILIGLNCRIVWLNCGPGVAFYHPHTQFSIQTTIYAVAFSIVEKVEATSIDFSTFHKNQRK